MSKYTTILHSNLSSNNNLPVKQALVEQVLFGTILLQQFPAAILLSDESLGILERIRHKVDVAKSPVDGTPRSAQKMGKMA